MSQNEVNEEIRPAADVQLQGLLDKYVRPVVAPSVYTQLVDAANEVAKAHYGRGFLEGGRASWYTA